MAADFHFLRVKDVAALTTLSVSAIWTMVHEGRMPAPRKLSSKITVWRSDEIQEWMNSSWSEAA